MKNSAFLICSAALIIALMPASAQKSIDLGNPALWTVHNRNILSSRPDTILFNALPNDGMMIVRQDDFTGGSIEFNVKGENKMGESFVGIAFNIRDEKNYEAVYFRPFNFFNPDTVRRPRAVQYIYMPNYPWEKLRAEHPGKYENRVTNVPDPDGWFHVKILIRHPEITVFVNGNKEPCLRVNSLSQGITGKIGVWMGNNSRGSFSNLVINPQSR